VIIGIQLASQFPPSQPVIHSANQPVNQPASQPASQPANQPDSQSASQPTNQPASQPANQPASQLAIQPASPLSSQLEIWCSAYLPGWGFYSATQPQDNCLVTSFSSEMTTGAHRPSCSYPKAVLSSSSNSLTYTFNLLNGAHSDHLVEKYTLTFR
jgi:hypothetical protein